MTRTERMAAIAAASGYTPKSAAAKMSLGVFRADDPIETAAEKLRSHRTSKHHPMSSPIDTATAERIRRHHSNGYTYDQIKRSTGYSENAIRAVIRGRQQASKKGFPSYQKYKDQSVSNNAKWESVKDEVARLLKLGQDPVRISNDLGVSQQRVVYLRGEIGLSPTAIRAREVQARKEAKAAAKLAAQTVAGCPK